MVINGSRAKQGFNSVCCTMRLEYFVTSDLCILIVKIVNGLKWDFDKGGI